MKFTVRQLRLLSGLSIKDTAKMLGINQLTYSNKESGVTRFYIDEAQKLAEIFEKDINDIIW